MRRKAAFYRGTSSYSLKPRLFTSAPRMTNSSQTGESEFYHRTHWLVRRKTAVAILSSLPRQEGPPGFSRLLFTGWEKEGASCRKRRCGRGGWLRRAAASFASRRRRFVPPRAGSG